MVASHEMENVYSTQFRYTTFRKLWINFAKCQKDILGLEITDDQISEMEENATAIDLEAIAKERVTAKDEVQANFNAFIQQCELAVPIMNLSNPSISSNTNLIIIKESIAILLKHMLDLIHIISELSLNYASLLCLDYSQTQITELTTFGKKFSLWIQDLLFDERKLRHMDKNLRLHSVKVELKSHCEATSSKKLREFEKAFAKLTGFEKTYAMSAFQHDRKIRFEVISVLSCLGMTMKNICDELIFLQLKNEIEVLHDAKSNTPLSQNCRMHANKLISLHMNAAFISNDQSILSEEFLLADACIMLLQKMLHEFYIYPKSAERNILNELGFIAIPKIVEAMEKSGINRQECERKIQDIVQNVKHDMKHGKENNFIDRIKSDPYFEPIFYQLVTIMDIQNYTGKSAEEVVKFYEEEVKAIL